MEQFIKYIEKEMPSKGKNDMLYKFKRSLLDEMNERYGVVMQRGITDTKVITDLVISEHPDLKSEYEVFKVKYTAKSRAKRKAILNVAGSIIYILCLIIGFLGISFVTQKWSKTWLIPVDGILLWLTYILHISARKVLTFKKIFHIFARLMFSGSIIILFVAIYLFTLVTTGNPHSWLFVIAGVASMFIGDGIFAVATKKKLAIINILLYIPIITTMLYIVLSALSVIQWRNGWVMMIASLILDFIIISVKISVNKKHKREVIDTWAES